MGSKLKDAKIPKDALSTDVLVKSAFVSLFLLTQGLDPSTFPTPENIPCAFASIMVQGCNKTGSKGVCFACGKKASWLPVPKGIVPKTRPACTPTQVDRVKDVG